MKCDCHVESGEGAWNEMHDPECCSLWAAPRREDRTCLPGKHHWHLRDRIRRGFDGVIRETCCSCPRVRTTQMTWVEDLGANGWWREGDGEIV